MSNAFTHVRGHADCGLHVAQDNEFELVLNYTQPPRADGTSFRYLDVLGWAAGAVVVVGFLLTENGACALRAIRPTRLATSVFRDG